MITRVLAGIGRHGLLGILRRVPAFFYWRYRFEVDHARWDRKWGTETSQSESEYLASIPSSETENAEFYEPVAARWFHRMLRAVPIAPSLSTFIDLGSGKGRALFLASRYGFKRVIGVEFSEHLHGVAVSNRARFLTRLPNGPPIELERMDAAAFDFPDGPLVVYMFNPFRGALMGLVVDRIAEQAALKQAAVYVVYKTPQCAEMFEQHGSYQLVVNQRATRGWFSSAEPFVVYRVRARKKGPRVSGAPGTVE